MRLRKNSMVFSVLIFLTSVVSIAQAGEVTANIINKSKQTWKINPGKYAVIANCTDKVCELLPKQHYTIQYNVPLRIAASLVIFDNSGEFRRFTYQRMSGKSCYLPHSSQGNTGPVTLNEPEDCGVVIEPWADNWDSKAP